MPTSGISVAFSSVTVHVPCISVPFSDFTTPPDIFISFTAVPYVPLRVGLLSSSIVAFVFSTLGTTFVVMIA